METLGFIVKVIIAVVIFLIFGYLFFGAVINIMYEAGSIFDSKKKEYEPLTDEKQEEEEDDEVIDFFKKI